MAATLSPRRIATPPTLTLGGLHRALRCGIGDSGRAQVTLHFEQRTSLSSATPGTAQPGLHALRRFDAMLHIDSRTVLAAELSAGGRAAPLARLWLRDDGRRSWYSTDGVRFGRLRARPRLFDLTRFERRLELVRVRDAAIEQVNGDSGGLTVVDADVDAASFEKLLAVFAGDAPAGDDAQVLRSYSVALAGGDQLALDYWWSLAADDPADADGMVRNALSCHVQVNIAPAQETLGGAPDSADAPALAHLDVAWAAARRAQA